MRHPLNSQFDIFLSLVTVLAIVVFDRISKVFFSGLLDLGESLPVLRNVLHMTLVHNTGIAFGLLKDQGIVAIIVPICAFILLVYNVYYYREQKPSRLYIAAFSMILGGAIGNMIDRIYYVYVIDFIDFQVWPVFNVADSAITAGALIIAIKCIPTSAR